MFTPRLFRFLRELADHNDRAWFEAHRDDYVRDVEAPALDFIDAVRDPLAELAPHFVADARRIGGSLFRIHRDLRFTKDKTPYKTHVGIHFRHETARDVHAPGFYLHLEPRNCFVGVGIWRPEPRVASRVRERILAEPEAWMAATRALPFAQVFTLDGERLQRPPRGVDPDHPLVDDLRFKEFVASCRLSQREVTSSGFVDGFIRRLERTVPFMAFLCGAVGVDY
ncbi:MAG TPA: DUF2461 domain-containing protein [Actinobacteria bacterium]|nr:DUF2461 domain-containing protein [Actinomycetota bacterium]